MTYEIEVVNLWGNRMIGDEQLPDDGVKDGKWPEWLLNNQPRTSGRFTFAPRRFYQKDSPLQSSGLIGQITIKKRLMIKKKGNGQGRNQLNDQFSFDAETPGVFF